MTNGSRNDQVHIAWLQDRLRRRRLAELERTGIRLILDELESRRPQAEDALRHQATHDFAPVAKRLADGHNADKPGETAEAPTFSAATGQILHELSLVLRRRIDQVQSEDDQEPAHQIRLAGKRVRYLLEPVRGAVPGACRVVRQSKQLQYLLGDMHDLHSLESRVGDLIDQAAGEWAHHLRRTIADPKRSAALGRTTPQLRACHALAAVLERVRAQRHLLFQTLQRRWLDQNGKAFFDRLDQICRHLDPRDSAAEQETAPAAAGGRATNDS